MTRLRVLDLVARRDYRASDLQAQLSISKANLSQHVTILKAAGVLVTHRDGKRVYCHLAIPEVKKACALIRKVLRAQIRNGRHLGL
jgi:ArsR family transcriptional regulator